MSDTEAPGSKDAPADPSRKPAPRRRKPGAKAAKLAQPQPQGEHAAAGGTAVAAADQPTAERASRKATPVVVAKPEAVTTPPSPAAEPSTGEKAIGAKKTARSRRKPPLTMAEPEVKPPEQAAAAIVSPAAASSAAAADAVPGMPTTQAALVQGVLANSAPADEAAQQPAEIANAPVELHYPASDSNANVAGAAPSAPPMATDPFAAPVSAAPGKPRHAPEVRTDTRRGSPASPPATQTAPAGKPSHAGPARPASAGAMPAGRPLISTPMSVRWRDLDAFNHVNNSKYLSYLEEARLQWMLGIPGLGIDDHVAPVVAASQLNYRRPITWPSQLVIELFVERLGNTSVTIGHRIVDANQADVLYCDGNVVMVWIDRDSGQAAALPRDVRRLCSP